MLKYNNNNRMHFRIGAGYYYIQSGKFVGIYMWKKERPIRKQFLKAVKGNRKTGHETKAFENLENPYKA